MFWGKLIKIPSFHTEFKVFEHKIPSFWPWHYHMYDVLHTIIWLSFFDTIFLHLDTGSFYLEIVFTILSTSSVVGGLKELPLNAKLTGSNNRDSDLDR